MSWSLLNYFVADGEARLLWEGAELREANHLRRGPRRRAGAEVPAELGAEVPKAALRVGRSVGVRHVPRVEPGLRVCQYLRDCQRN